MNIFKKLFGNGATEATEATAAREAQRKKLEEAEANYFRLQGDFFSAPDYKIYLLDTSEETIVAFEGADCEHPSFCVILHENNRFITKGLDKIIDECASEFRISHVEAKLGLDSLQLENVFVISDVEMTLRKLYLALCCKSPLFGKQRETLLKKTEELFKAHSECTYEWKNFFYM